MSNRTPRNMSRWPARGPGAHIRVPVFDQCEWRVGGSLGLYILRQLRMRMQCKANVNSRVHRACGSTRIRTRPGETDPDPNPQLAGSKPMRIRTGQGRSRSISESELMKSNINPCPNPVLRNSQLASSCLLQACLQGPSRSDLTQWPAQQTQLTRMRAAASRAGSRVPQLHCCRPHLLSQLLS